MEYNAHEQGEITKAKLQIKQAKEILRDIEWGRKTRTERQIQLKNQARQNMEDGVKAIIEDVKRTAPIGYNAVLDSHYLSGLWSGTMTVTLVFKPLV